MYKRQDRPRLQIRREVILPVRFDLCVRPGTQLRDIRRIITHPHAAAQVRDWLATHLPDAVVTEKGSTAAAAQTVSDQASTYDAAICASVAGKMYGLVALEHDIADNEDAVTRFVLVRRPRELPAPTGSDKTTFTAYMRADRSGALLEILSQLAMRGVNLCRIESRPTKTTLGSYCFSIDAEGHVADARLAEAMEGMKRICKDVVFLGSYARADGQAPSIPDGGSDADYAAARAWVTGLQAGK